MLMENPWRGLRDLTSARIALGRAGHSLPTRELLSFQIAHAKARDAVWEALDSTVLAELNPVMVATQARDRATYLRRPDLGRSLTEESKCLLTPGDYDAALILADGLSAEAIHRHGLDFTKTLISELHGWKLAPLVVVRQGRVAVGDEIGELLNAQIAVMIIGERPGLSSPDSLGVYLTWSPRVGRTDAERNCVSNIRTEGCAPKLAAKRVAEMVRNSRERRLTGLRL